MRPDDLPAIRELSLFADMQAENFTALVQNAYLQHFPPQLKLITEGDPADFLYIVVEGTVELFAQSNGRETTMEIVHPVASFILAAVLNDAPYLMSARTLAKSRILLIPAEDLRVAFVRDEAFARSVVRELSIRYRAMVKALKNHKLRTSVERLANYLIALDQRQNRDGVVSLPHDKKTLATLLGMTAENLSRAFASLGAYGVIVEGIRISITKPKDLKVLAKPTPLIDDPDI